MISSQTLLHAHLRPLAWRLRLRDTLALVQRTAWVPGAGFIAIQLVGRLVPITRLAWWSLLPLALWLLGLLGYLLLHRLSEAVAARRVDHLLDLRERLSTALELSARPPEDEVEELQQADALAVAQRLHPRQLGWALRRSSLAHFLVPLLLGVALVFLPNPQDRVLREQVAVAEAIKGTIQTIEAQREALGQNKELSEADRERLQKELEQLDRELRANPRGREEALAKLSAAEARLREGLDPQVDARRAGLEGLSQRLAAERQDPNASRSTAAQAGQELQQLQDRL